MSDKTCGTCKSFMFDPSRPCSGACNRHDASTRSSGFENGLGSDRYFRVRADGEPMTDLCWRERTDSLETIARDMLFLIKLHERGSMMFETGSADQHPLASETFLRRIEELG